MANDLRYRIDMPQVNEDGTIEVIDTDFINDFPFTFQYKLYETVEENMKRLFSILYSIYPEHYELTSRFKAYVENRAELFEKAQDFLPTINCIKTSKLTDYDKRRMIKKIDLMLNELYPYKTENQPR